MKVAYMCKNFKKVNNFQKVCENQFYKDPVVFGLEISIPMSYEVYPQKISINKFWVQLRTLQDEVVAYFDKKYKSRIYMTLKSNAVSS